MSLFKNLFGKNNGPSPDTAAQREFDEAWERAVTRFQIVTGVGDLRLQLKHPKTNQPLTPHEGLGGTFTDWQQAQASYDRRRVLFSLLYQMTGKSLKPWQAANYLVSDSRPDQALALLEASPSPAPQDADYAEHCAAAAQAHLGLTRYADALDWAQKATAASPDTSYFQTLRADALHLLNRQAEAHEIYDAQMTEAHPTDSVPEMFRQIFSRETGAAPSPILALEIAEHMSDPTQAEEFWQFAELEFYASPYFRMHHAYHLASIGETQRSFAKLYGLVDEMPWVKEASLNLERYFQQFDPSGTTLMPEFQTRLRRTIQQNGWSVEGMRVIEMTND